MRDEVVYRSLVASDFTRSRGQQKAQRIENELGQSPWIRAGQCFRVLQFLGHFIGGQARQRKFRTREHELLLRGGRQFAAHIAACKHATELYEIETIERREASA